MSYKGFFKPRNGGKYRGDPTNIVYRSRWELVFMAFLDMHPDVLEWSSEEFSIRYFSPVDQKGHRYFPDFYIKKKNRDGRVVEMVVEIKPYNQTMPPTRPRTINRRFLYEARAWGVNSAKWAAADHYCKDRGWTFAVLTEKHLGLKF